MVTLPRKKIIHQDNIYAADNLFTEFITSSCNIALSDIFDLVSYFYNKYYQFNDITKDLFRRLIVSHGTGHCVIVAEWMDLTKEVSIEGKV